MITINEIRTKMIEEATHSKLAGCSFEEWLANNDGTHNCYTGWVSLFKRHNLDDMRRAWDELDGTIKVGLPCTIFFYSDHKAATVSSVVLGKSGKNKGLPVRVEVMKNKVVCKDFYSGDYDVMPETYGRVYVFTKRPGNVWAEEGYSKRDGVTLGLGFHDHYIDPSF